MSLSRCQFWSCSSLLAVSRSASWCCSVGRVCLFSLRRASPNCSFSSLHFFSSLYSSVLFFCRNSTSFLYLGTLPAWPGLRGWTAVRFLNSSVSSPMIWFFLSIILLSRSISCSSLLNNQLDPPSLLRYFRMVTSSGGWGCALSVQGVMMKSKSSSGWGCPCLQSLASRSSSRGDYWVWGGCDDWLVQGSRSDIFQFINKIIVRVASKVGSMSCTLLQDCSNMSEQMRRVVPPELYALHYPQITFRTTFGNCVLKALQSRGWRQIDTPGWHLQWSEKERVNDVFEEGLTPSQRTNHFRLWGQLCRKDMLIKNIRKHKRLLQKERKLQEEDWDFLPLTFFLPSQYIMFAEDFKKKGGLWIMKPTARCQGSGIFIVDKLSQVAPFRHKNAPPNPTPQKLPLKNQRKEDDKDSDGSEFEEEKEEGQEVTGESYLIQQYISRPLLLGNKKFDLRIYCLCTNYSQLTAWLYRSGFARFTHEPYSTDNIEHLEGHLTNVEIQKHSENYDEVRGGKWLVHKLKHFLFSRYDPRRVDWCFTEIQNIIIRSLQAVQKHILPSRNSFELYGYDFMIDESLKPWLIEVNGGPSMTANTPFDCVLKCGLIDDVLTIIDLEGILTGQEMTVGGFDLIVDKGIKVVQPNNSAYTGLLGAHNQRLKVMKAILANFMTRKGSWKGERPQGEEEEDGEEKVPKKKEKAEGQGREKLLPDFYYRRKVEGVDWQAGATLKEVLSQHLRFNEDVERLTSDCFKPMK